MTPSTESLGILNDSGIDQGSSNSQLESINLVYKQQTFLSTINFTPSDALIASTNTNFDFSINLTNDNTKSHCTQNINSTNPSDIFNTNTYNIQTHNS